jgi:dimethylhistidine N-methyltransferase
MAAHELWEDAWRAEALPHLRPLWKALAQAAAALVHAERGNRRGALRVGRRARSGLVFAEAAGADVSEVLRALAAALDPPRAGQGETMHAYSVLDANTAASLRDESREFALDVLQGLSETPKRLSSRYFYDAEGSRLFARIMDVPQYYLSACEREILETHAAHIVGSMGGEPFDLVDLGAGDGRKTQLVLDHVAAQGHEVRYVPIDISEPAVAGLVDRMKVALPAVPICGLVSEYTDGLRWLHSQPDARRHLVLFLGSNIGNFHKPQARAVLRRLWSALDSGDRVLIGFDLKKDIDLLLSAYNDPQGVTAEFNLNLLRRINRELGGNFPIDRFRHYGTYNVFSGAMESYLVCLERQDVHIEALETTFHFEPWEPIHTEYSFKYLHSDIEALARDTSFSIEASFEDRRGWFVSSLWRPHKPPRGSATGASSTPAA